MSKIQFGVVVPQGWSYDFSLSDKDRRERDEFIAIKQYEYSKDIAEAIDKYTSIDSIYTYDHFLPYYAPKNETNFFDCFILLSAIAAIKLDKSLRAVPIAIQHYWQRCFQH